MKFLKLLVPILFITLILSNCKKDDDEENNGPSNFDLLFVANNETDVVLNPKLIWEIASGKSTPVTYTLLMDKKTDLELAGLKEPSTEIKSEITQNYFEIESNLNLATEYVWKVIATDNDGNMMESTSVFSFTTTVAIGKNQPPNSFKLLLPINGFIDAPLKPSLSWEVAKDPNGHKVTYDVYLGQNPNPGGMVQQNISGTSFTVAQELAKETTYYWWVEAKDNKGASTKSTVFSFKTIAEPKNFKMKKVTLDASDTITGRYGHQVVFFKGALFLLGGKVIKDQGSGNKNDVLYSSDGYKWEPLSPHYSDFPQPYFPSDEHQAVAFGDYIWVFDGTRNTINRSPNGVTWESVKYKGSTIDGTHWKGKHGHQVITFLNQMWIIGGTNAGVSTNDIWSSSDGINWTKSNASFTPRIGHSATVHNERLYVIGGLDNSGKVVNDVWSTTNGKDWIKETDSADFSPRSEHDCESFGNNLVLVGGQSKDDVWFSPDGKKWTKVEGHDPEYKGRSEHQIIRYNGKLFTYFGKRQAAALDDIWVME